MDHNGLCYSVGECGTGCGYHPLTLTQENADRCNGSIRGKDSLKVEKELAKIDFFRDLSRTHAKTAIVACANCQATKHLPPYTTRNYARTRPYLPGEERWDFITLPQYHIIPLSRGHSAVLRTAFYRTTTLLHRFGSAERLKIRFEDGSITFTTHLMNPQAHRDIRKDPPTLKPPITLNNWDR